MIDFQCKENLMPLLKQRPLAFRISALTGESVKSNLGVFLGQEMFFKPGRLEKQQSKVAIFARGQQKPFVVILQKPYKRCWQTSQHTIWELNPASSICIAEDSGMYPWGLCITAVWTGKNNNKKDHLKVFRRSQYVPSDFLPLKMFHEHSPRTWGGA